MGRPGTGNTQDKGHTGGGFLNRMLKGAVRRPNRHDGEGVSSTPSLDFGCGSLANMFIVQEDETDSPTSPLVRHGLPFHSHHNPSSASIDRASEASGHSEPQQPQKPKKLWVFVTNDGRHFTLVDITSVSSPDDLRRELCAALGVNDWDEASIYLTEPGKEKQDHSMCSLGGMVWGVG